MDCFLTILPKLYSVLVVNDINGSSPIKYILVRITSFFLGRFSGKSLVKSSGLKSGLSLQPIRSIISIVSSYDLEHLTIKKKHKITLRVFIKLTRMSTLIEFSDLKAVGFYSQLVSKTNNLINCEARLRNHLNLHNFTLLFSYYQFCFQC